MIIGLTGGIASGKSTATNILEALNVPIIDADAVAREITEPGQPTLTKLSAAFGEDILEDGVLNRSLLRKRAFVSPENIKMLNAITHPAIHKRLLKKLNHTSSAAYKILSAPLLFENSLDKLCNETWLIDTHQSIQLKRIQSRDNCNIEAAKSIIDAQLSSEKKREYADIVIDNSRTVEDLQQAVLKQHRLTLEKLNK